MKHWFADSVFRAVLRNAGYLGSTKLLGAGLGLIALACAGRALDPVVFGILMIVHTYSNSFGAVCKFQSWQLILRYGGPALLRGDEAHARDAIRFAFGLDLVSGLAGMAAAMVALPLLDRWLQLPGGWLPLAIAYCTLVPTMAAATPTGVLRLLDRFDLLAAQQIATPLLRAAGAAAAWGADGGLPAFVASWYVADLGGDLILWGLAVRELRRRHLLEALRPGLFGTARRLPQAWAFVWTTNLATSINAAWGPVGNLVVAGVLGPVAAGLYKIATTLLDSAGKPADLITKGFYPEIMRLDPGSRRPWRLALRTGLLAGAIGLAAVLVVMIGGRPLIVAAFGRRYLPAYALLRLMLVALIVTMASSPFESLLYMVRRQRAALAAQAGAAIVYIGLLATMCRLFGLPGAGAAYMVGAVALAALNALPVFDAYRHRERYAWPGNPPAP